VKQPHKYRAVSATVGGIKFSSKKEARRWCQLQLLEQAGEIRDLKRQVKVPLLGRDGPILTPTGRKAHYVADFTYTEARSGLEVIEDAKGYPTPEYMLKRAVLAAQGVRINEV
jgi:hypothetical protein